VPKIISNIIGNQSFYIIGLTKENISQRILDKALELGFLACGFSKVGPLEQERVFLYEYLQKGYHGKMQYMENHFEKRLDPGLLVEGSKSVVSVLYNYFTDKKQADPEAPVISRYAYGKDYHLVVKEKLHQLLAWIKLISGTANGRVFVDSAPILEKAWAQKAGLGWIGKNGNFLNKEFGSYFFIGEILLNIELEYKQIPVKNYCGQCTRCIDACPTKAIVAPAVVDGSRCISYLTIELKDEIPSEFIGKMENRVFGCDICQEVCPFNKKAKNHQDADFLPGPGLLEMLKDEWYTMDENTFNKMFANSAVKRTTYQGLVKNLHFLNQA
jgi:epoxyqueuosine reductase